MLLRERIGLHHPLRIHGKDNRTYDTCIFAFCGSVVNLSDLFYQSAGGYKNGNKTRVERVGLQVKKRNER